MATKCGYNENGLCTYEKYCRKQEDKAKECAGENKCDNMVLSYSSEDKRQLLLELIDGFKKEYNLFGILGIGRQNLPMYIAICGHCSQVRDDFDSISYEAGNIVLLQHYAFWLLSDGERLTAYRQMRLLGMKLSALMRLDYKALYKAALKNKV